MHIIRPITEIPPGFDAILEEMTREYREIYGRAASEQYETRAEAALNQILAQPGAVGFAAYRDKSFVGIAIGSLRMSTARLDVLHRLGGFEGEGIESALCERLVSALTEVGPDWISVEFIPLCSLDIEDCLESLGFCRIERALMVKRICSDTRESDGQETFPLDDPASENIAALVHRAFSDGAVDNYSPSFESIDSVSDMLRSYANGEFGPYRPKWARGFREGNTLTGVILGSAQALDTGFVFQVAVDPEWQRRGAASALMRDLERAFHAYGMRRIMLGVTMASPAFTWYTSLGYAVVRRVSVYHRNRDWIPKRL